MSDTCIVCLGDLSHGIDADAEQGPHGGAVGAAVTDPAQVQSTTHTNVTTNIPTNITDNVASELIAHLQPCGHDLHDECLKPWVERANSCPICRASFHLVELMNHVGGEAISSYTVQDKTQVAEVDPSLFLEVPDFDSEDEVCQECGECDNEDILMYCDGCNKLWHTYCVDLDEVPHASWFCENCSDLRSTDPYLRANPRTRGNVARRRTRGLERRRRNHNANIDDGWNQVWQSVWSQLNLDLDFPYEDDASHATMMRRHRQRIETNRREHEAWERRMRVAELAGGGNRFRETVSTLLDADSHTPRNGPPRPVAETAEEIAAWDAFSEAQNTSAPPQPSSSRGRKRKSPSSSPAHDSTTSDLPTRENKRRRSNPPTRPTVQPRAVSRVPPPPRTISPQPRPRNVLDTAVPSFLQSLLQEVEDSAVPTNPGSHRPSPRYPTSPAAEQQSPRPSSPATSNPSSPRALSATPPPMSNGFRPTSPPGLSSTIQPIFPPPPQSPPRVRSPELGDRTHQVSARENGIRILPAPDLARPKPRRPHIPQHVQGTRPRSNDTSPSRPAVLTADAKADVQKLVASALRTHYQDQKISKEEYTTINRDVSRMLYDKIGNFEALDLEGKARWEKVASEEVNKAVFALRT